VGGNLRITIVILAAALWSLPGPAVVALAPEAAEVAAQPGGALFIQGDMVDGTCVLRGRYTPGERVVFRVRAIDPETGEMARDATATVRLEDGTVLPMRFSGHPARPPQTDEFWATSWNVPADTPVGIVRFTIEAVDGPCSGRFEPFNLESSLLTIMPVP
jgi:hypothetical protein